MNKTTRKGFQVHLFHGLGGAVTHAHRPRVHAGGPSSNRSPFYPMCFPLTQLPSGSGAFFPQLYMLVSHPSSAQDSLLPLSDRAC